MRTTIRASCIDQKLKVVTSPMLASGGMNEAEVAFDFCEKWDGFAKTGVFYRDEDNVYYSLLNDNDVCIVPHEVYDDPGTFYFTVFGDRDSVRRTASTVRYKAHKGIVGDAMMPSDPTPDVYDQIMASVADMNEKADSGALAGPKGDPGYTPIKGIDYFDGEKGDPGYTPIKGVDYFDGKNGVDGKDGNDGYTPIKGVDYFDGKDGKDGKDGTSVTITNISESNADGGSNVVTFSDGKTLTVKNGSKGSDGEGGVEIPEKLPNPHALTFTGAATGTYDGSSPLTVNIPEGGDESNLLVVTVKSENGEYVSSHTYQEIKAFVENGGDVALCVEGTITSIFSLSTVSDTHAFFGKQAFSGQLFISQGYYIKADGSVTFDQQMIEIPEGGGGVSDWNDLTNRPFYDNEDGSVGKQLDDKYLQVLEVSETDIFHEQDVAFSHFDAFSCYVSAFPSGTFVLKAGEEYKVLWGVDEFTVTAENVVLNGTEAVAIGNTFLVTGVDNGLPFAVGSDATGGVTFFAFEETTTKVRIYQSEGYKIKPSYLPDSLYTQIDKRIEDYINEALGGDF